MEGATEILTALAAGCTAGVSASATRVVTDCYAALKRLILNRFDGDKSAEAVLTEFERDPEKLRTDLEDVLRTRAILVDPDVLAAARRLLLLVSDESTAALASGTQIGNNNRQVNLAGTYIERNQTAGTDGS